MGALDRPQTAEEHTAEQNAATEIARLTDGVGAPAVDMIPGNAIPGSYRILASTPGTTNGSLYAFRTDRLRVCAGLSGQAGGCFEGFLGHDVANWSVGDRPGGGIIVFGMLPDRVRAVNIVFDDATVPATVAENAFYAELPDRSPNSLRALELVTDADRVPERVPISLGSD
jgi:hypothetical protein